MNQPAEPQGFPVPKLTWEDVKAADDRSKERQAHLIQCVGEIGRGLDILDKELRHGQFNAARTSVDMLRVMVQTADALLAGGHG